MFRLSSVILLLVFWSLSECSESELNQFWKCSYELKYSTLSESGEKVQKASISADLYVSDPKENRLALALSNLKTIIILPDSSKKEIEKFKSSDQFWAKTIDHQIDSLYGGKFVDLGSYIARLFQIIPENLSEEIFGVAQCAVEYKKDNEKLSLNKSVDFENCSKLPHSEKGSLMEEHKRKLKIHYQYSDDKYIKSIESVDTFYPSGVPLKQILEQEVKFVGFSDLEFTAKENEDTYYPIPSFEGYNLLIELFLTYAETLKESNLVNEIPVFASSILPTRMADYLIHKYS